MNPHRTVDAIIAALTVAAVVLSPLVHDVVKYILQEAR